MRASVSQVANYQRVRLGAVPPVTLAGPVVDDLIHLLTELRDNSLRASDPSMSVVFVVSPAVENGLLLEIVDRGIGIPPADSVSVNRRLAEGAETDAQATRHLGLYVVGRVAQRHGLKVRLRPTRDAGTARGITASVYLPAVLVTGSGADIGRSAVERPRRLADPDSAAVHYSVAGSPPNVYATIRARNVFLPRESGVPRAEASDAVEARTCRAWRRVGKRRRIGIAGVCERINLCKR